MAKQLAVDANIIIYDCASAPLCVNCLCAERAYRPLILTAGCYADFVCVCGEI